MRVKDRELEESEERHMMEVKVYKQKVKHLLYEQGNNVAERKAENMVSLKVAREEWRQQEQNHLRDKQQLGQQLHDKDKQYTWHERCTAVQVQSGPHLPAAVQVQPGAHRNEEACSPRVWV